MQDSSRTARSWARALFLGAVLWIGTCAAAGDDAAVTVRLLAFNDFHGALTAPVTGVPVPELGAGVTLPVGGAARLAGLIGRLRQESPYTVVVAAGDLIGASPLTSAMFHDEPSIEVLNAMGLAFSAVGNHELDHGIPELRRMQQGGCATGEPGATCLRGTFKGAQFRYLAANIIDRSTGMPVFPAYAIQEIHRPRGRPLQIAFIGAVTRAAYRLVTPDAVSGLTFTDEADAINGQIREVRERGVDAIVVLIHEGGATAARQFDDPSCPGFSGAILPIMERLDPAVDLVISGHTHMVYICRVGGRLVTSAGAQGQFLTAIDVTLDPGARRVTATAARQLPVVNDSAPDPAPGRYPVAPESRAVRATIDFYSAAAASVVERRVTRLEGGISRRPSPAGESALGDLVADAQLAATAADGAQIAFVNTSGIRRDLGSGAGWVTYGDLFACQPFGNRLVTLTLTGEQLHALLEHQWETGAAMLQVSGGFSYRWLPDAPVGARVDVRSMRLNGVPIDPAGAYRITVNDFLAGGGDGFTVLTAGTARSYGPRDVQALEQYLKARPSVSAPELQRISRTQAPSPP